MDRWSQPPRVGKEDRGLHKLAGADITANGWMQAQLGIRAGGLLRDPAVHAAGTYLASFRAAKDLAARIDPGTEDCPGFDPQDTNNHWGTKRR